MFWNIWDFILWREVGKKKSSCSDYSKYISFTLGKSEQISKIWFHFGIFNSVVGVGQWYDNASSHALKCICELFGNI